MVQRIDDGKGDGRRGGQFKKSVKEFLIASIAPMGVHHPLGNACGAGGKEDDAPREFRDLKSA